MMCGTLNELPMSAASSRGRQALQRIGASRRGVQLVMTVEVQHDQKRSQHLEAAKDKGEC